MTPLRERWQRWRTYAVVAALIGSCGACYVAARQRDQAREALAERESEVVRQHLEAVGLVRALQASERELQARIDDLLSDAQRRAVREAGAKPIMHARTTGRAAVTLPDCPPPPVSEPSPLAEVARAETVTVSPGPVESDLLVPPVPARLLSIETDADLVAFRSGSDVFAAGKLRHRLMLPGWEEETDAVLDPVQVSVSEDLRRAIARKRRPLIQAGMTLDVEPVLGFHWPIQKRAWYLPDWVGATASASVYPTRKLVSRHSYLAFVEDTDVTGAAVLTWQVGK